MNGKFKKLASICLSALLLTASSCFSEGGTYPSGGVTSGTESSSSSGGSESSSSSAVIGGGTGGGKPSNLPTDTRFLSAQDYSIANLTAIDDYGRTVTVRDPSNTEKKYLGMFYFAWLGNQNMRGIYDVSKLERENPTALLDPNGTLSSASPAKQFHFNSEPLFGYYSMKDPWVLTRHIEMLTMAGVDYVLFDFTNAVVYEDVVKLYLETAKKFLDQGWNIPKVGFYTNSNSLNTVNSIYQKFYASGKYNDMWFRFDGDTRPVIVGVSTANGGATDQTNSSQFVSTGSEVYKYFNFYESQWPSSKNTNQEKGFPWMQWGDPLPNNNGFISVSVAQHSNKSVFFSEQYPNSSRGYDGDDGKETDWKKGANFQWQWDTALAYNKAGSVKNVFVTGWNEWTAIKYPAGKYDSASADIGIPNGKDRLGKEVYFVDEYNAEHSRDIEPGKEFGDGFYIQLTQNGRLYKTSEAKKYNMKQKTIKDLSDFSAWKNVFVEYADFVGDAIARDGENAANIAHTYIDNSNRNDIKTIKVAHNGEYLYFYVETAEDITAYNGTDKNWMNILISAGDTKTSFAGFNYVINRSISGNKTTIEKCSAKGYNWTKAGEGEIAVSGNKMAVKIPLSVLGLNPDNVEISFKVCDNVQNPSDILDYYVTGDSAPIGRFGYAYGK